jgi:lysophospholipase L1-like esterase
LKKIYLLLCLGSLYGISFGQVSKYDTIRYAKQHYDQKVLIFESQPLIEGKIIFMGNSHIENADWKSLVSDSTVINRGIGGDNTFGVLNRLDEVIMRKPSKLFIEIGINDISQGIPLKIIIKNIKSIVERIHNNLPKTRIFFISILPTNDHVLKYYPDIFGKNNQVNLLNSYLKKVIKKKCFFIDLNVMLKDSNGKLLEKYAKTDGIHLNEAGYQIMIKLLKENNCL